jgi:putative (di)nucleoside polyphosphate hydrolase
MARLRQNVCVAVRKTGSDLFLVCHRKGFPPVRGWQFPQGGLHKGEDLISGMKRELLEEIGTDDIEVVAIAPKKYTYAFPPGTARRHGNYTGQTQQWVLAEFSGLDSEIKFDRMPAEFDAFEWVTAATVLDRIVDFKKNVYAEAMQDMGISGE